MKELRPSQTQQEKWFKRGKDQYLIQRLDNTASPDTSRFQVLVDDDDYKFKPISFIELKGENAPIEFAFAEYLKKEELRKLELTNEYLKETAKSVKDKFLEIYKHNYEVIENHLEILDIRLMLRDKINESYHPDSQLAKEWNAGRKGIEAQKEELREEAKRLGYDSFEQMVRRNHGHSVEAQLTAELFQKMENDKFQKFQHPSKIKALSAKEFSLEELKQYSPERPEVIKAADTIGQWAMEASHQIIADRQFLEVPVKNNRWSLAPSKQPKEEKPQKKSTNRFKR